MTIRIEDALMSLRETATALGYKHHRTLSNRIHRKLPVPTYVKVPDSRKLLFFRSDVEAFLRSNRISTTGETSPSQPDIEQGPRRA